ncbi:DUF4118 domain-containing protein [Amedibacillus sp. YH-ame6]
MNTEKKGKLKIFFGYCAGVGKTYAMLAAAHEKKKEGVDVIIGYVEKHARAETIAMMDGLEEIPVAAIPYKDIVLHEFDLDAALKRKPELILVDELAHTNAATSRHPKRYSDIQELLHAGIDVYTTVNVQHLESLQDVVASITRIRVNERIPDKVFDQADQVELVDIEPDDLIKRLEEGKIYKKSQVSRALENFFMKDNLVALREIALRRCADRVNMIASSTTKAFTKEHIMICLSPSPSNAKVIRTAARMAAAFFGEFTAIYVETPDSEKLGDDQIKLLDDNIRLAHQLGANVVSVFGEDVAEQISEYAKIGSISKIVIGRSFNKHSLFSKATLVDRLTSLAPDIDIYIIPDKNTKEGHNERGNYHRKAPIFNLMDSMITIAFLIVTTLIGLWFHHMGYTEANIIMIYILAVLLISFLTRSRFYGISASFLIVFIFNFFFTFPRFSFQAYAKSYPVTFAIMLMVALITNTLTRKGRQQTRALALQAHRTEVLLEASQKLQLANTMSDVAKETCLQLHRLLNKTIIVYSVKDDKLQAPIVYNDNLTEEEELLYSSPNEQAVAQWVFKNNKKAGVSTSTLPAAKGLYFSVRMKDHVFAVIGIAMEANELLPPFEKSLLTALLNEVALVMESVSKHPYHNVVHEPIEGI